MGTGREDVHALQTPEVPDGEANHDDVSNAEEDELTGRPECEGAEVPVDGPVGEPTAAAAAASASPDEVDGAHPEAMRALMAEQALHPDARRVGLTSGQALRGLVQHRHPPTWAGRGFRRHPRTSPTRMCEFAHELCPYLLRDRDPGPGTRGRHAPSANIGLSTTAIRFVDMVRGCDQTPDRVLGGARFLRGLWLSRLRSIGIDREEHIAHDWFPSASPISAKVALGLILKLPTA